MTGWGKFERIRCYLILPALTRNSRGNCKFIAILFWFNISLTRSSSGTKNNFSSFDVAAGLHLGLEGLVMAGGLLSQREATHAQEAGVTDEDCPNQSDDANSSWKCLAVVLLGIPASWLVFCLLRLDFSLPSCSLQHDNGTSVIPLEWLSTLLVFLFFFCLSCKLKREQVRHRERPLGASRRHRSRGLITWGCAIWLGSLDDCPRLSYDEGEMLSNTILQGMLENYHCLCACWDLLFS